jgi:serine/threonine-protein kinase HipA
VALELEVFVGERPVLMGRLWVESRAGRSNSTFRYDVGWLARADAFTLSPGLPLGEAPFFASTRQDEGRASPFPGGIADTCPDAWGRAVIRRHGVMSGDRVMSDEARFLAGVDDALRFGALRFCRPGGQFERQVEAGRPIAPAIIDLKDLLRAANALQRHNETAKDLARLMGTASSLGGARPKCVVRDETNRLFMAKFPSLNEDPSIVRAEVLALKLGALVGISVPAARFVMVSGKPVALMERFDRGECGRIPAISAQTMLDAPSADGACYRDIAESIRANGASTDESLRELFRRMGFTVLVSNTDDHLKNHAFLHAGDNRWMLSPMFDVNPQPDRRRSVKTELARGSGAASTLEALLDTPGDFGLKPDEAAGIVAEMAKVISEQWRGLATSLGMSARNISDYSAAFQHEETRKALVLAS